MLLEILHYTKVTKVEKTENPAVLRVLPDPSKTAYSNLKQPQKCYLVLKRHFPGIEFKDFHSIEDLIHSLGSLILVFHLDQLILLQLPGNNCIQRPHQDHHSKTWVQIYQYLGLNFHQGLCCMI